jgi:hypothetical protein
MPRSGDACPLFRVRGQRSRREGLKRAARTFRPGRQLSELRQRVAPTNSHAAISEARDAKLLRPQRPDGGCRDDYRKSECAVFSCLPRSLTAAGLSFDDKNLSCPGALPVPGRRLSQIQLAFGDASNERRRQRHPSIVTSFSFHSSRYGSRSHHRDGAEVGFYDLTREAITGTSFGRAGLLNGFSRGTRGGDCDQPAIICSHDLITTALSQCHSWESHRRLPCRS